MSLLRTTLSLAIVGFIGNLHNTNSQILERVIQKNNTRYLSNTVVVKFKELPSVKSNNELNAPDKLRQILNER